MRPLELTIEGFRSYSGRVTFDWRDRRLVGIVGPIGSGKSSVLDAITFALYGKTPRVEGATKDLINQHSDRALVELVFEVDGTVWKALRGQNRKSTPPPFQLQVLDASGEVQSTVATSKSTMNSEVEKLLGLSYDAFCRSVMLAQNQFALFLTATTGGRDEVLKGVFGLDVIDDALTETKRRRDSLDRDLMDHDRRLDEIEEARSRLTEAKQRAADAKTTLADLRKAEKPVTAQTKSIEEQERIAQDEGLALAKLQELRKKLPAPDRFANLLDTARTSDRTFAELEESVAAADKVRRAAETAMAALEDRLGGETALDKAKELLARKGERERALARDRERVTELETEAARREAAMKKARDLLATAERSVSSASARAEAAETAVASATSALDSARHSEMAGALRAQLTEGQTCPVCEQPVHQIPRSKRAATQSVRKAERALKEATVKAESARTSHADALAQAASRRMAAETAEEAIDSARKTLAEARTQLAELEAAATADDSALTEMLGEGDHRKMIEERDRELDRARADTAAAARSLDQVRADLDAARDSAASGREALAASATTLAAISGALDIPTVESSTPETLESAYSNIDAVLDQRQGAITLELERISEAIVAERAKLDGVLTSLGLANVDAFAAALSDAAIAKGTADAEVAALKERIASEKELKGTIEKTVARRDRLERLAKDLTPANFLRFLLEEDRATLAELGSEHCETLTNGRYRFSDDGEFRMVDLNAAEQTRKADSLSGGETFLASLALALALAEMVSRGGGRLDAFFLDEGFGSLDAEHMDLAMDGIDRLIDGSDTRLVVLVSHVAEMRERIEDLIVLDKDPVTGDTLVRSGTGTKT